MFTDTVWFYSMKVTILLCTLVAFHKYYVEIKATTNEDSEWWKHSIIYQIYPRSFKDTNNDGNGDLRGILENLDYFSDLGVEVVWLSPIFKSPMYDGGYDISNFTEIDPLFGTMKDFELLVKTARKKDIKLILDFVPNHTSDESIWFKKSIQKIDPYTDYYVWKDPKGWTNDSQPIPPNNWISVFDESAWTYNADRKQFYFHDFTIHQPDLNYRSKYVVQEMSNILKFWLNKGVYGFRIDSAMYIYENSRFRDEPVISNARVNGLPAYAALDHIYTENQPETFKLLESWRKLLDSYSKKYGETRIMLTEAYTSPKYLRKYYGTSENPIAQVPFNFLLLTYLNYTTDALQFKSVITEWLNLTPKGDQPNWVLGNHDNPRMTSRFAAAMADGLNILLCLLPGIAINYQGDEIGMRDFQIRYNEGMDNEALILGPEMYYSTSRDPERTPFQWDNSTHAGFSNIRGQTWLPVHSNYYELNLYNQKNTQNSHYNVYKKLTRLRRENVFRNGHLNITIISPWVLAIIRSLPEEDSYIVVLNLNNNQEYVNLRFSIPDLPSTLKVIISSVNSEHIEGSKLRIDHEGYPMRPNSALVLQVPQEENLNRRNTSAEIQNLLVNDLTLSVERILQKYENRNWT